MDMVGKKSVSALYPTYCVTVPKRSRYLQPSGQLKDYIPPERTTHFSEFCTSNPAMTAIVVGSDAAHTPSRFKLFSSIPEATTRGGAHCNAQHREGGSQHS